MDVRKIPEQVTVARRIIVRAAQAHSKLRNAIVVTAIVLAFCIAICVVGGAEFGRSFCVFIIEAALGSLGKKLGISEGETVNAEHNHH